MPIDFDPETAKLLGTACYWAADNEEGDAALIAHYPMICMEVLKGNKSWEQLEDEALKSYARFLSRDDRLRYLDQLHIANSLLMSQDAAERAAGEAQWDALQRLKYGHYSRILYCKLIGNDPETHVWNDFEIGLTVPGNLSEAAVQRLLKVFEDDQRIKQVQ